MKDILQKFCIMVVLITFTVTTIVPMVAVANDTTINQLQQEKDKVSQEQAAIKSEIKNTVVAKNKTLGELESINKELNKVENDIDQLTKEISETITSIEETVVLIDQKQIEYDERMAIFAVRIKEIYQYGDVDFLEVLFQASNLTDFLTRFEYLSYIANNDQRMLEEVLAIKATLEEEKNALDEMKISLEMKRLQQEEKSSELEIAVAEKQRIVEEIEAEQDNYYDILDALEEESNRIAAEIKNLQTSTSANSTAPSSYVWPLPSSKRVTSVYGMRMHPTKKVYKMHTGVDIAGNKGADIVAAAAGTVIMAQYYGSYGNCIMVDHGGGVVTLYAHMSAFVSKTGDVVSAGQTIGKVGTTGASTGNHLHFEVRINGSHVSPNSYIGKYKV